MKSEELDATIRAALTADERKLLDAMDEPSVPEQLMESFRGRNRWLNILAFIYTFAFFGLAIWFAVEFFATNPGDTKTLIAWAAGFLWMTTAIGMAKMWSWMQMHKNVLIREIKRLELEVSLLRKEK